MLQPALKLRFLSTFEEGKINFPPTYKLGTNHQIQDLIMESIAEKGFQVGPIVSLPKRMGS